MSILICGSMAFDTIMVFKDQFKNHILPESIHKLSVAFYVPELRKEFGGTAGNIAYNLKLLNEDPVIMATVGNDFSNYFEWLNQNTINISHIKEIKSLYTAQAYITTDLSDNQITAFHPGAMVESHQNKIKDATGIFSSDGPISVTRLEREKEMGIKSSVSMEAEHPIVKTVNGKKTLYVSPGHLMKIKNVEEKDAGYLKDYLIQHVNKEEFIFSYEWNKNDICLWDNLSILHMASEIKNCKRVMHRITIK